MDVVLYWDVFRHVRRQNDVLTVCLRKGLVRGVIRFNSKRQQKASATMGVPGLFKWIMNNSRSCVDFRVKPALAAALFIDVNAALYGVARDWPAATEAEFFSSLEQYFDLAVNTFGPQHLLYLALDGVAPAGKMITQRSRRFMSTDQPTESPLQDVEPMDVDKEGSSPKKSAEPELPEWWDVCGLSPGTEFMNRVADQLRTYAASLVQRHPRLVTIVSSTNVPGEGEQKLMDHIRRVRFPGKGPTATDVVILGGDADIIIMALAVTVPYVKHIICARDLFHKKKPSSVDKMGFMSVHALKLRKQILAMMRDDARKEMKRQADEVKVRLTSPQQLHATEKDTEKWQKMPPSKRIKQTTVPFQQQAKNTGGRAAVCASEHRIILDWIALMSFVGNDFIPHLPSLSAFLDGITKLMDVYRTHIIPTGMTLLKQRMGPDATTGRVSRIELNPQALRIVLERLAETEVEDARMLDSLATERDVETSPTEDFWAYRYNTARFERKLVRACDDYLNCIEWIVEYYTRPGCPDVTWYYGYHHAPTASALLDRVDKRRMKEWDRDTEPVTPLRQLMNIIPPAAANLVPKSWRWILTQPDSPMADAIQAAKNVKMDARYKMRDFQAIRLAPDFDAGHMASLLDDSTLDPEESKRNETTCIEVYRCEPEQAQQ
jgi:5'-3' exonuclease